ncbi:VTC domain-containing protein [Prochlorococcus sp. AH-716-M09]|nr:VTC domain-containing protein [Prochlorococcus sp. AH-716-M09]
MLKPINYQDIHNSKKLLEVKYIVPQEKIGYLYSTIKHHCITPKNFAKAKLKTFYFDDQFDTSFYESKNGEIKKTKYRFREYLSPEKGGALYSLELKLRYNSETSKIKKLIYKPLSKDYKFTTFRNLISEIEQTNNLNLKYLCQYLPERILIPTSLIEYERSRFDSLDGSVRYNIDTNISTTLGLRDFLVSKQKIYLNYSIFEIKTQIPEFFPFFLKQLKLKPSSFSKFAWGKEINDKMIN